MRPSLAPYLVLPGLVVLASCGDPAHVVEATRASEAGWELFVQHRRAPSQEKLDRSIELLEEARAVLKYDPDVRYRLGRAREECSDVPLAMAEYSSAVLLEPGHGAANRRLGALLLADGRFADAEECLRRAIEAGEGSTADGAELRFDLGQVLEERGELVAARAEYESALEIWPGYDDALFRLSHLLRRSGEEEAADQALAGFYHYNGLEMSLTQAREKAGADPTDVANWREIGRLSFGLFRSQDALDALDVAIGLAPDDEESLMGRAVILGELGREEEARLAADSVLDLWARRVSARPGDPGVVFGQAMAAMQLGRTELAASALSSTIAMAPDHIDARLARAQLSVEAGRPAEAIEDYKAVLALEPEHGIARAALEQLEGDGR